MNETRAFRSAALAFAWTGALVFVVSLSFFLYCYEIRYGRATTDGRVVAAVGVNLLLFSIFALHHSILARSGAKRWLRRCVPAALERSTYTWVASTLLIAVCEWWRAVPGELYSLHGVFAGCGYGVQVLAVALVAQGSKTIDVLDLAGVRPVLDAGRGRAPRHVPLATTGAYGFVRHPVYFAWMLFVFGSPHMTATRFTFAAISTAYLAVAIPFEERSLIDLFGADYRGYQRKVRWRMIPGLY